MNSRVARKAAPAGFLWGTALSAHQTEGNNVNADTWLCEQVAPTVFHEPSGDACDSYHRFEEDIAIAAGLGFNCHRFGIEWSRIEPEPGCFSEAALDHYVRQLEACHARGLAPMVTLSHFTVPRWFAARGGFEVTGAAALFARFAERVGRRMGDLISYATTFNEANIQRLLAQLVRKPEAHTAIGKMLAACARASGSPHFSSLLFAPVATTEMSLLTAHAEATAALKAGPGDFPVGLTLSMQDVQGVGPDHRAETLIDALYGPWLAAARAADFIGVQTYTRVRVDARGPMAPPRDAELTGVGYEFYPQSLGGTIRFAHERIGRPIFVTECGIATDDDSRRIAYLDAALAEVRACLDAGIDVRSFICWSLLDNFEWTGGYGAHFGLVAVDRATFARHPKPSAWWLGQLARGAML